MSPTGQLWAEVNCTAPANHPGCPLSSVTWPSGYGAPGWESSQEWLIQPSLVEHKLPCPTKCDWLPAELPPHTAARCASVTHSGVFSAWKEGETMEDGAASSAFMVDHNCSFTPSFLSPLLRTWVNNAVKSQHLETPELESASPSYVH